MIVEVLRKSAFLFMTGISMFCMAGETGVWSVVYLQEGKTNGVWKYSVSGDELPDDLCFDAQMRVGAYTGTAIVKVYYTMDETREYCHLEYSNGVHHGKCYSKYRNGTVASKGEAWKGNAVGTWMWFDTNEVCQEQIEWTEDEKNGPAATSSRGDVYLQGQYIERMIRYGPLPIESVRRMLITNGIVVGSWGDLTTSGLSWRRMTISTVTNETVTVDVDSYGDLIGRYVGRSPGVYHEGIITLKRPLMLNDRRVFRRLYVVNEGKGNYLLPETLSLRFCSRLETPDTDGGLRYLGETKRNGRGVSPANSE